MSDRHTVATVANGQVLVDQFPGMPMHVAQTLLGEAERALGLGREAPETLGQFVRREEDPITRTVHSEVVYTVTAVKRAGPYVVTELARDDRPAFQRSSLLPRAREERGSDQR